MLRGVIFGTCLLAGAGGALAAQPDPAAAPPAAVAACPYDARTLAVGTQLRCTCAASVTSSGSVWGSGPYTADSTICRAAVHAGAIRRDGGEVRLRITAGRERYRGSERRGVSSGSWASFPASLEFDR